MIHDLKSWPANFNKLRAGCNAEVRPADRNFALGDHAHLREYLPTAQQFTDRTLDFRVKWIHTAAETPGLMPGFVVLVYAPIVAGMEVLPPTPAPRPDEKPTLEVPGWMCDASPVMQVVEDARGERHQLLGPELADKAGMGASGILRIYPSGRKAFEVKACPHEFVGMACALCGLPRSFAVV